MSNSQLALKVQTCILAAKNVYLIKTKEDAEKAAKCLSALKEDGKQLQRVAEESKDKCAAEDQELEEEIVRLTKEKDSYDLNVSQLNDERRNEEYKLSQQRQTLSYAEYDFRDAQTMLSDAESELRRAKEKERATMATAVTTGVVVGLFTFGIGGLAAAAAVGAGLAALNNEIEGRVDKARERIRLRGNDVASAQSAIHYTNQALSDIQCRINDYKGQIANSHRSLKEVHEKITENKPTLAIHRQAFELWELFAQASEDATEITQRLEEIVEKANEEQNLRIIRSNGTIKIAESLVEAWEEISFNQGRITAE